MTTRSSHDRSAMWAVAAVVTLVFGASPTFAACASTVDTETADTVDAAADGSNPQFAPTDDSVPMSCEEATARKSNVGCDYWPTVVANNVWSIFDYAVVVANAAKEPVDVTVTGPGGVNEHVTVAPERLEKIFLPWVADLKGPDGTNCGKPLALTASVRSTGGAYHLVSSKPVTVYQFSPLEYVGKGGPPGKNWDSCPGNTACDGSSPGCYSFTNDASLLLPSTALTGNYRITGQHGWSGVQSAGGGGGGRGGGGGGGGRLPDGPPPLDGGSFSADAGGAGDGGTRREMPITGPYFVVTATQNATTVVVKVGSKAQIVAGDGIASTPPGGTLTLKLDAGDVAELTAEALTSSDFSGTLVKADKPIQVLTGSPCMQAPIGTSACDHLEESVFPVETLGSDYVVASPSGPHGNVVGQIVRIYGNVDRTELTYDPAPPENAPSIIDAGDVYDLGVVKSSFRVKGTNSFAVATFLLGADLVGASEGDPSQSHVVPTEQFRTRYVFLAPRDYDLSYVDVVAPDAAEVTLDNTSVAAEPSAVGKSGYTVRRLKLSDQTDGVHTLIGTQPIGIQVIGYGSYTSYQYPGGLNMKAISPIPVK